MDYRRRGDAYERGLLQLLRAAGLDVERLRPSRASEGDLVVRLGDGTRVVIEAKDGRARPGEQVPQLQRAMERYRDARGLGDGDVHGVVIVKGGGVYKPSGQSWVRQELADVLTLWNESYTSP